MPSGGPYPIFMRPYTLLALVFSVCLALIPPIDFVIHNPYNDKWLWMVMIAGFAGIFLWFIKTSIFVKIISLAGFLNCFFSCAPYLSFTAYVLLVICCYFYVVCERIESFDWIFKALQAVVLLNLLLLTLSACGHDTLMNFANDSVIQHGVLGQHMMMGSFAVIIAALVISYRRINFLFPIATALFCTSTWTLLASGIGIFVWWASKQLRFALMVLGVFIVIFGAWSIQHDKFSAAFFHTGRVPVWMRSLELTNQRPWTGWGIATYKDVFPAICRLDNTPYRTAHNFIVQLAFEVGYPLTGCLLFGLGCLSYQLFKAEQYLALSGLFMIFTDALVHFPDRMIQTVPLIIVFLGFCQFKLRRVTA